jgi:hypothetical protein
VNPAEVLDKLLRPGGAVAGAPDIITLLGSALGLGFLSGFRLYATVLALGLAIRFHWFTPNETMSAMTLLADWRIMSVAAALGLVEFLADKIPWVDSAWDSIHTFIRPVAATVMAMAALGNIDPVGRTIIGLLCGGIALTAHSAKAATRFAVNHSPEPYSNWLLSVAEDLAVPLTLWFISAHPGIFLAILLAFLGVFAYLAPKIWRQIRVEMAALRGLINRWLGVGPMSPATLTKAASADPCARDAWDLLHGYVDAMPPNVTLKSGIAAGVRSVATRSLPGLNRSIGYLCFRDKKITFLTTRWFRTVAHSMPYAEMKSVTLKTGFLLDQVSFEDLRGQKVVFDLFRCAPNQMTAGVKISPTAPESSPAPSA